jgi:predicted transcriptional regulator
VCSSDLPVLIDEVERALASVSDPKAMSHGQAILKLARQASSEAHTYLKFIGD